MQLFVIINVLLEDLVQIIDENTCWQFSFQLIKRDHFDLIGLDSSFHGTKHISNPHRRAYATLRSDRNLSQDLIMFLRPVDSFDIFDRIKRLQQTNLSRDRARIFMLFHFLRRIDLLWFLLNLHLLSWLMDVKSHRQATSLLFRTFQRHQDATRLWLILFDEHMWHFIFFLSLFLNTRPFRPLLHARFRDSLHCGHFLEHLFSSFLFLTINLLPPLGPYALQHLPLVSHRPSLNPCKRFAAASHHRGGSATFAFIFKEVPLERLSLWALCLRLVFLRRLSFGRILDWLRLGWVRDVWVESTFDDIVLEGRLLLLDCDTSLEIALCPGLRLVLKLLRAKLWVVQRDWILGFHVTVFFNFARGYFRLP